MAVEVLGYNTLADRPLDGRLTGLVEKLAHAQRRSAVGASIAGVVTSLVIGLGLFCILQLLHALLGDLAPWLAFGGIAVPDWLGSWLPAPGAQHFVISVVVAVIAMAVSPVMALLGRPFLSSMARAADRRFQLDECMSTALELSHDPDSRRGVVPRALLQSADSRSVAVDAKRLVPLRLPSIAIAIPVLLAIAVLLNLAPPPPLLARAFGPSAAILGTVDFAPEERLDTAAELRAIAAILRQDGEERADPVLQAIARELGVLGTELATNPTADRGLVADQLERLMGLAGEAYARAGETAGGARDLSRLIEAALGGVAPERAAQAAATEMRPPQATPREEGAFDTPFEAVLLDPEYGAGPDAGEGALPGAGLGVNPNQITQTGTGPGNYAEATEDYLSDYAEVYYDGGTTPVAGEGELVGAGVGGGNVAGIGGAALYGPDGTLLADRMTAAAELILADREAGDGRRITLNLPPLAELMPVDGEAPEAAAGWRAFGERQVERTPLPALGRDMLRRYFDAMMAEPAE